jgi:hypothetical protein
VASTVPLAFGYTSQSWPRCMFLSEITRDSTPASASGFARSVSWRWPANVTVRSSGRRMGRRLGVPAEVIKSIKFREPTGAIEAPFGTHVQLIRKGIY